MVIRNMRGTTSAAAATIRAVGAGQRQGSCDHAGGQRRRTAWDRTAQAELKKPGQARRTGRTRTALTEAEPVFLIRGSTAGPPVGRLGPRWDHPLCTWPD